MRGSDDALSLFQILWYEDVFFENHHLFDVIVRKKLMQNNFIFKTNFRRIKHNRYNPSKKIKTW